MKDIFWKLYGEAITGSNETGDVMDIEFFCELIVQEMCQVINDDCELQMRQRIITNLGGLNQARELIKKHFGVEE